MGQNSNIEWTDHTWNPWQGCLKVSPGCKHCYMYRDKKRYGQDPMVVVRSKPGTFQKPLQWKNPAKVFTCSWSDFFIDQANEWRDDAWEIIRQTPHLTYQILTKRPENIKDMLPPDWGKGWPNVWLGASVENQEMADKRIPELVKIPAQIRFLSCEPLLGPVVLPSWDSYIYPDGFENNGPMTTHLGYSFEPDNLINWVIAGGESGPKARPVHPNWIRSLRDQCAAADVPFFFKQWGEYSPAMYRVGKHKAGRVLDGREWNEFPVCYK